MCPGINFFCHTINNINNLPINVLSYPGHNETSDEARSCITLCLIYVITVSSRLCKFVEWTALYRGSLRAELRAYVAMALTALAQYI